MSETIKISLEIDNAAAVALGGFTKKAGETDKSLKKLEATGKSTFDQISVSIGKSIGVYDLFKGNLAANLATKAFDFIKDSASRFFDATIQGAAESEQAIKNLNVALEQAGLYTSETSKRFQDYANELQRTTIYGDEAVLTSVALLASLTTLDEDGLKAATTAAADLATTIGVDLATATEMISKAVNGNTKSFQLKGITIQKADTSAGMLANTLAALATQEGAAAKAAETYSGARAKGNNQQGEFLESIGKLITQSPSVIAALKAKSIAFESLAKWVTDNTEFIRTLGSAILITAGIFAIGAAAAYATSISLGVMTLAAATSTTAFGVLGLYATVAWAAITAPISLIVIGIAAIVTITYQVVKNFDAIKSAAYNALAATLEFAAKGVAAIGGNAKRLQDEATAWRDKAQAIKETSAVMSDAAKQEEKEQADAEAKRKTKLAQEAQDNARLGESEAEQTRVNQETLALIEAEGEENLKNARGEYRADALEAKHQHEQDKLQLQIDADVARALLESDSAKRTANLQAISDKASLSKAELLSKQKEDVAKRDLKNQTDTLNLFAGLANSNNKTLAGIGKAAALTQLAIKTPEAVGNSFAFGTKAGGPILGAVFAGIASAAMAAQAAQIAGIQFNQGGIVPGTSYTGDKIPARVNSGEMVLNTSQQAQLFEMANGRGNSNSNMGNVENLLGQLIVAVRSNQSINIDGREVFSVIRDGKNSGRTF